MYIHKNSFLFSPSTPKTSKMARPKGIPAYRLHKPSGRAVVTINGTMIYLGFHGTRESKAEYDRIIREWLANNRQLSIKSQRATILTVDGLCNAYLDYAKGYYTKNGKPTDEVDKIKTACDFLHRHCGDLPAEQFSRASLKAIRDEMIKRGWKRKTINQRIGQTKRIFRWGAEEADLIPASTYQEIKILSGLKKYRSAAKESTAIKPVSFDDVKKTLPFCNKIVQDMAMVQYYAGMRPGEICALTGGEINRSGDVWFWDYTDHKMTHKDKQRIIWFGKQAQKILNEYIPNKAPDEFLFSPRDATMLANIEKRKKRKSKVQPSQISRAKPNPKNPPRTGYDVNSYRRAITRAAKKAEATKWAPNQLRHSRATEIRAKYGLEGAQVVLGHDKADVTQIYAERDNKLAERIMREIG